MENSSRNLLFLSGRITSEIKHSHESHGASFYTFSLETRRLSGTYDTVNILVRDDILNSCTFSPGNFISIRSELRSFNKKTDSGNRLVVSAFAKEMNFCEDDTFENELHLIGTICKPPIYRKTPLGREICDIMLAINRNYGRSDYLPLIAWGRNAKIAAEFDVGDIITVSGRVQSREYTKMIDGVETVRIAYEVSVSSIEPMESQE